MVVSLSTQVLTDAWLEATWDQFTAVAYAPEYKDYRAYFDDNRMRIEMPSLGVGHSRQNGVVWNVVTFFAATRGTDITGYLNASFQKVGEREFQPDVAFYIGDGAKYLPPQNNSPVSVELFGAPTLVIEVGASSVQDDLGWKRLLYERVGVPEYWVVDVDAQEVFALSIEEGRSGRIQNSVVLPGLEIGLVEEALRRSQTENDGAITRWLMELFRE